MQFSLRTLFYAVTWLAGIAGLAVSPLKGWTVFAAGYSLACLNSMELLARVQTPAAQPRMFRLSWLLFAVSLALPCMKGCNNADVPGWQAAVNCGELAICGLTAEQPWAHLTWLVVTVGNLILALSPAVLWRLQCGKGTWCRAVFALAAATIWCLSIADPSNLLVGFYVWSVAAIVLVSAYRIRWPHLLLMALAPLLVWLSHTPAD